ncbi:MAG: oligopeptidase B, partial [Flavobacteriales bacterium]
MAKKIPHSITEHNHTRIDEYYWMRLSDEQKNDAAEHRDQQTQDVIAYLEQENKYTENELAHTKDFQLALFEEMKGRVKETDQSVPVFDNGYWYYTRYEAGKDYAFHCRKKESMSSDVEEIIINGPELAHGHAYWSLGGAEISDDNTLLAYSEDTVSRRIYTARFRNLTTNEMLPDVIEGISGCPTWANDNQTVFYTKKDPLTLRTHQVWRHELGKEQSEDVMVFEEMDEEFLCGVYKSKSKKYMVITSSQTVSSEYRVLRADDPFGMF